jgi:hypothetical protein
VVRHCEATVNEKFNKRLKKVIIADLCVSLFLKHDVDLPRLANSLFHLWLLCLFRPTLFIGEQGSMLYALPSLVDEGTVTITV